MEKVLEEEAQTLALEIHNLKKDLWDFQDTLKIQAEIIEGQKERLDGIEEEYKRYLKHKNFIIEFFKNLFCGVRVKSNDEGNKSYSSQEPIGQRKATDVHEAEI